MLLLAVDVEAVEEELHQGGRDEGALWLQQHLESLSNCSLQLCGLCQICQSHELRKGEKEVSSTGGGGRYVSSLEISPAAGDAAW